MRQYARHRAADRGQTLVEFGLILPIFILVLIGLFDVGRAVYAFNTITNAAREGIRLGIVDQNVPDIQDKASQHAASIAIPAADVTVDFLDPQLVDSGTCTTAPYEIGCVVQVTVEYDYTAATPIIGNIVGQIHMEATTNQPIERSYVSP